ncbi:MAG TPA: PfkB family carbohydrate kinase, partial [Elusimicrobiales bacterium]|nr:PfkB family carbohydrate kinase [Elusimicrobiales bacterium]
MDKLIKQELIKIVDNFKNKTIGIIGDVILDKYIFGKVRRISPEAPVPIVEINSEKISFGGSSNVASNISDLGGKAVILSVLGNDSAASEISSMMREKKGIDTSYIIFDESQKTIEKTRIIAEHQ